MMDFTKISFPGLGIGPFEVPAYAFSIGGFGIRWSLLIFAVGAILAFWYAAHRAKRVESVSVARMLAIGGAALVLGLIFARGAFVLSTYKTVAYGGFLDVIAFWNGGVSFDAGILGAIIGAMIVSDLFRYRGARVLDILLPSILIIQLLASVAMLLSAHETVAIADTSSYYLFRYPIEFSVRDGGLLNLIRMEVERGGVITNYHPLFLYQFVWYLITFVVVHVSYKRRRYSGQTALLYFAFLGVYTMLTKGLAVSVRRWNEAQCMGLLIFAVALIALIVCARRVRNPEMEINGSIPELRTFTRPMTAQEKAAKREADVLWASEMLDRKVEDALDELNGKKS